MPRYRWRTAVRTRLPWFLIDLGVAAKGRRDCGEHAWYKQSDAEDRCYHCVVGVRRPSRFTRELSEAWLHDCGCPDLYLCAVSGEVECPRHSGFDTCCDRPQHHLPAADLTNDVAGASCGRTPREAPRERISGS